MYVCMNDVMQDLDHQQYHSEVYLRYPIITYIMVGYT